MMPRPAFFLALIAMVTGAASAAVEPVVIRAPKAEAWAGQRLPVFVDLRARGSFAGTATFDLPEIPGVLVVEAGDSVVETQEIEGESWVVQTHEFALFAQHEGKLTIPPFAVRFSRRNGYTGPASEVNAKTPSLDLQIRRPPGASADAFVITTESMDVSEIWKPEPRASSVGAVFKRTIRQRADQMTGMALAPAPQVVPDGVRVYPGVASTHDNLVRGAFVGEREETLTYLLQEPGKIELPALTYVWWNPKTETLQSKTLPSVVVEVAAASVPLETKGAGESHRLRWWLMAAGLLLLAGLIGWQHRRVASWAARIWMALNPPQRTAARRFLHACRQDDAEAAEHAWTAWRSTQPGDVELDPKLRHALIGMQRHRYGCPATEAWRGDDLARAFDRYLAMVRPESIRQSSPALPPLNPRS